MSTGTSFSATFAVTTGATPPSAPRPRPARPPVPGPAADEAVLHALAATAAEQQRRTRMRVDIFLTEHTGSEGGAFTPRTSFDVSYAVFMEPCHRAKISIVDEPLIRDISDTARWVAVYRARETERPD